MILLIECIVACVLFTLIILPAQYKDPLKMIASYPPEIIKRVEELPQYKDTIKQRKKSHISKKIFGLVFLLPCCQLWHISPDAETFYPLFFMYLHCLRL